MKIKNVLNKYCPRCNQYTEHSVSQYKKGRESPMSEGNRRMERKLKGYGSFPKPIQKRFAKTTKKATLKYTCRECGHTIQKKGMRIKKLEIVRA
ncbi:MAG: 50S ribosomal protein L44e [Candidatus Lokiarchaeota archaeon]|jgi:large subunit ribosomal protein L44e|nr:50S ribosomal protein L44e [Candidatus Lokiarchaeota archaeon]